MIDSDAQEFRAIMAGLGEIYGKPITRPLSDIYWRTLRRYRIEQVREAAAAHLQDTEHGMFFPKPADLIRHMEGGTETRALNAWSKLIEAIRTIGAYQTVVFDDWRIHATVHDLGGWQEVCGWDTEKRHFHQRDFERLYRSMREGRDYPPKLIGIFEHENEQRGYFEDIPPPILIGDPVMAERVLEHQPTEVRAIGPIAHHLLGNLNP